MKFSVDYSIPILCFEYSILCQNYRIFSNTNDFQHKFFNVLIILPVFENHLFVFHLFFHDVFSGLKTLNHIKLLFT